MVRRGWAEAVCVFSQKPEALRKAAFYPVKDGLLQAKRRLFAGWKAAFCQSVGNEPVGRMAKRGVTPLLPMLPIAPIRPIKR